jgi:adenosylmethionine-8-amino-7-oxononanoate aminotransferase
MRVAADTIALSPPLIIKKSEIDQLFEIVRGVLKSTD